MLVRPPSTQAIFLTKIFERGRVFQLHRKDVNYKVATREIYPSESPLSRRNSILSFLFLAIPQIGNFCAGHALLCYLPFDLPSSSFSSTSTSSCLFFTYHLLLITATSPPPSSSGRRIVCQVGSRRRCGRCTYQMQGDLHSGPPDGIPLAFLHPQA